ncbi:ATP synthase protein I [Azospirillaceae bacterium]
MAERYDPLAALDRAVQRKVERHEQERRDAQRTLGQNLAWMGALGWLMVTPPLLLGFLGRWLDRMVGSGVWLTALLLVAGFVIGGRMAWARMHEE